MAFLITVVTILFLTNTNGYYLSPHKRTWTDASKYCIDTCGSTLATINTVKASKLTQRVIEESNNNNDPIWIGLLGDKWTDTTEYKYTRMYSSDTSINDKCSVISPEHKYKWTHQDCQQEYRFICNSCDGILNEDSESNNQWKVLKGSENSLKTFPNDQTGFAIHSSTEETIAIIKQKQWKQCDKYRPWVVEMKYNIYQQKENYNIGYVFYNNKKSKNDHYFIRVKSIQTESMEDAESIATTTRLAEVSLGYIFENKQEIIAVGHISNFAWTDTLEETLRVEIEYGLRFKVYLNDHLILKTGFNKNPFDRSKNEVMSGYIGVESLYSNVKISEFIVSGMPLNDNENDHEEEWMKTDCIFTYNDETDNDQFNQETTTTLSTSSESKQNTHGDGDAMNMHPDIDVLPTADTKGFDMKILIISAFIAIFCCMICVGIYHYKLKRDRKKKLDRMFGNDHNPTISIDVETSQQEQEGQRPSVALPVAGFNSNNTTVIDMNLDGPQPIGIDLDLTQQHSDQFQFSDMSIDNFAQYNTYDAYQPQNSWDIAAIEANCNNILKNSHGRRSRHSRHASFS